MSKEGALVEMETLNQIIMIDYWINECSSKHRGMKDLIREVRKLTARMIIKQQTIATSAVVEEAKKVDLSNLEDKEKEVI